MKLKEYRIPIPLTLDEYHLGQQWTEFELFKENFHTCLTLSNNLTEKKRLEIIEEKIPSYLKFHITSSTIITHKKYHFKDQKPKYFDLFFLNTQHDFILDEYSINNWPYTLTIIENLLYSIRIIIQSYYNDNNNLSLMNNKQMSHLYFSLNYEQIKNLKDYEIINIAEQINDKNDYHFDEDLTRNFSKKKPNILPLELNTKWYENSHKTQPSMCVYKLIELIMLNDKSFLSKAMNKLIVKIERNFFQTRKTVNSIEFYKISFLLEHSVFYH